MPGAFGISDVELSRWWRGLGMERMEYVPVCVCVCVRWGNGDWPPGVNSLLDHACIPAAGPLLSEEAWD
jgi:hypothetical protein